MELSKLMDKLIEGTECKKKILLRRIPRGNGRRY